MLKCKEIVNHSSDYLDRRLPFSRHLSVWLHIMMCGHCRRYLRYLKIITALLSTTQQPEEDELLVDEIMAKIERERAQVTTA